MSELSIDTTNALRRILTGRQSEHRIPGVVGGVARDGELLWSDGVGAADLAKPDDAPDADTQFLIASITKTFTAVVVMALRDEGKLSLDDTVDAHVPETQARPASRSGRCSATRPGCSASRSATSGTPSSSPDRDAARRAGGTRPSGSSGRTTGGTTPTSAYSMLGEIIARIDGREWAESLQARILDPLGMRRTTVGFPARTRSRLLRAAVQRRAGARTRRRPARRPRRRAHSPATGQRPGHLGRVPRRPRRRRPRAGDTLEEMCQPQIMADLDGWRLGWGLGLMMLRSRDRVYVGHDGGMPGHITGLVGRTGRPARSAIALMNSTTAPDPAAFAIDLAEHVSRTTRRAGGLDGRRRNVPDELAASSVDGSPRALPSRSRVRAGRLEARIDAGAPRRGRRRCSRRSPTTSTAPRSDARSASCCASPATTDGARDPAATGRRTCFTREPLAFGEWL